MKITTEALVKLLENAGGDPQPYSGRGMMGRQCVSVRPDDDDPDGYRFIADMIRCEVMAPDDLADVIATMRADSMGRGCVLYWPRVAAPVGDDAEPRA